VAINDSHASDGLIDAFVAAFPSYVRRRLDELGIIAASGIDAVITVAAAELRASLEHHLRNPVAAQTDSPLELVRRATARVTQALITFGVRPQPRDDWEQDRHPEDLFALYPASSRDLGDEVWRLHIEWGTSKAEAVAGVVPKQDRSVLPGVVLFGVPADERQTLINVVQGRGLGALVWRNPAALTEVQDRSLVLAIVDLRHPEAHATIRSLTGDGVRVVATGDAIDTLMTPGLLALGAIEVIPSARLAARLDDLLPRLG